jgi:DNA-binding response OmpR family regulator
LNYARIVGMENKIRILVIDDDPSTTEMLGIILAPIFIIDACNSSVEGLKIAQQNPPDLLILDLMMPDLDGIQLCKELRKTSSLPILILSAWDTPGTVAEALNAGADDFMVKPVACNMLISRINKMVRRVNHTAPLAQALAH